jgi:hypothetical protein
VVGAQPTLIRRCICLEHQRQKSVVGFHQCHDLMEAYSELLLNLYETITIMWCAIMTLQTVNEASLFVE